MGPADLAVLRYKRKREKALVEASKRTRSLCVGTLVVIWGVFSGTGASRLSPSPRLLHCLLGVAVGAVIVLALDLMEPYFIYQDSQQVLGESSRSKGLHYDRLLKLCVWTKFSVGGCTLVALCAVLFLVLGPASGNAREMHQNPASFVGEWCGGKADQSEFICLKIGDTPLSVGYNEQGQPAYDVCYETYFERDDKLDTTCDGITIEATLDTDGSWLHTTAKYPDGDELDRDLKKQ